MAAKVLLKEKRPRIFWTSCAAHTVDLMIEGISKLPAFKGAIAKAREMTVFIYSHHKTLAMMRRITEKKEIVRPGATRFATNFLTLQSLHEKKAKLRLMFSDATFRNLNVAKTAKGKRAEAIVMSAAFWKSVARCIRVFAPLFMLLRTVDSDYNPSMGFVVGMLEEVKEQIRGVYKGREHDYKPVIDIIEAKAKDRLDSSLHMAGYFLNPHYFYKENELAMRSIAAKDGFIDIMELFYPDMDNQIHIATFEIAKYMDRKGSFGRAVALASCKLPDCNPAIWWYMHGRDCPMMQHMAIKVLNLTSSSSGCERNWSTFEGVHTKKRNRLLSNRLRDLVYVRFNAKLKSKKRGQEKNALLSNERNKARSWLLDGVNSDDDEEVTPGSGLTWRMVDMISGASEAAEHRRSDRLAAGAVGESSGVASDDDITDEDDEEDYGGMESDEDDGEAEAEIGHSDDGDDDDDD